MKDIVQIKGNRYGLSILLDDEISFNGLKQSFIKKLEEGRKFFGTSKISVEFSGRKLTREEEQIMVNIIHTHSDMEVFCVVDDDMPVVCPNNFESTKEKIKEKVVETVVELMIPEEASIFHQGTLRSGQEINVDTGVVIIGDVNPGAKVTASGNIVVLGSLKGYAHAGYGGTEGAFVFALKMKPTQIRINRVIARSPDQPDDSTDEPQIAYLEENRIVIEEIHSTLYKDYKFLC